MLRCGAKGRREDRLERIALSLGLSRAPLLPQVKRPLTSDPGPCFSRAKSTPTPIFASQKKPAAPEWVYKD